MTALRKWLKLREGDMSKERNSGGEQLLLDLATKQNLPTASNEINRRNVVNFVDSGTLALRLESIRHVQASGIFEVPTVRPKSER